MFSYTKCVFVGLYSQKCYTNFCFSAIVLEIDEKYNTNNVNIITIPASSLIYDLR